jgi:hypothetical protein
MKRAPVVACWTMALTLLSCESMRTKDPVATDVCGISTNSARFHQKAVTLKAMVLSDLIEHTFLVSAQCPSDTVSLSLDPAAEGAEAFKRALVDGMPNVKVLATFTGTFQWRPGETPARVLNVTAVRDLVVKK